MNAAQRSRAAAVRMNTRTFTRRSRRVVGRGTLGGVQADKKFVYRKKSMPKKKKRIWRRFVKKVNAISEKELGLQTVLINDQISQVNSTPGKQSCLTLALYSWRNLSNGWLNDLRSIGGLDNTGNPTAVAGTTLNVNSSIMFQSAVMDLTIRNASTIRQTVSGVDTDVIAPEAQMELDIYEVFVRKNNTDASTTYADISQMLNAYDAADIGGAGTGIAIDDRGASPFEMSPGLSRFGIKIISKTKYFIPGSQTITYQMRDPKRHVCKYGDLTSTEEYGNKWTKQLYLIYKLVPGFTLGTTLGTYKSSLLVGSTRKYGYKVEGRNEPRERYLGNTYNPVTPS